jgi:hypothetical protein
MSRVHYLRCALRPLPFALSTLTPSAMVSYGWQSLRYFFFAASNLALTSFQFTTLQKAST